MPHSYHFVTTSLPLRYNFVRIFVVIFFMFNS